MLINKTWIFWIILLGTIVAIYGPRFYQEGLFADGVTYACIARNMAIGKGSFWQPYFSSSFWLTYNTTSVFYEHPPLMFWMESLLFRIIGDYYFVEKIYSFIIFVITGWLIVLIWNHIFKYNEWLKKLSWCAIMVWISMPEVEWSTPNNMLDNTMGMFSLMSVYFMLHGFEKNNWINFILAASSLLAAFITKGPIGLFPLIVPVIYVVIFGIDNLKSTVIAYVSVSLIIFAFSIYLYFDKNAFSFIQTYFNQQIISALSGSREVNYKGTKIDYVFIIADQLRNGTILIFVLLGIYKFKKKSISLEFSHPNINLILFFILTGFSGSLPIILSAKQAGYYLIPATPLFAIGLGIIIALLLKPFLLDIKVSEKNSIKIKWILGTIFILINLFAMSYIFKQRKNEASLLYDIQLIKPYIHNGEKIGVCKNIMQDFNTHSNINRYLQAELTLDYLNTNISLADNNCDKKYMKLLIRNGYKRLLINSKRYIIFQKKPTI
ncbi:MAG: glycosyltransferase family 39 protein [Bacteroidota bacterium]|nr:glycosyltransferase family 39 protein [Bacteroidota bacterium]